MNAPFEPQTANVKYLNQRESGKPIVHVVACKKINKGDEILVDYGTEHWAYDDRRARKKKTSRLMGPFKCERDRILTCIFIALVQKYRR